MPSATSDHLPRIPHFLTGYCQVPGSRGLGYSSWLHFWFPHPRSSHCLGLGYPLASVGPALFHGVGEVPTNSPDTTYFPLWPPRSPLCPPAWTPLLLAARLWLKGELAVSPDDTSGLPRWELLGSSLQNFSLVPTSHPMYPGKLIPSSSQPHPLENPGCLPQCGQA